MNALLYILGSIFLFMFGLTALPPLNFTGGSWGTSAAFFAGSAFFGFLLYGNLKNRKLQKVAFNAKTEEVNALFEAMKEGAWPEMVVNKVRIKPDEKVRFAAPAELMKLTTTGYKASTAGASVRIAKGLTLRTGGVRGGAIKELTVAATGELAMLNTRLVFAGDLKSIELAYKDIIHAEMPTDGVIIHAGKQAYTFKIRASKLDVQVAHAVLDRLLAE